MSPKTFSLAAAVLNTPLATLIHQAFAGELDHDPLIVLPREYVPTGHQFIGQLQEPAAALISVLRALQPYQTKFEIELEELSRKNAPPEKGLQAILRRDSVAERSSAIHQLLTVAALVQFPSVNGVKFRVLEGTVCIADADSAAKSLWPNPAENPLLTAWDALQLAVQGIYENNGGALDRFERGDYCDCGTRHETEDAGRCFNALSNDVTRSLLHFWAFVVDEQKKFEPPTNEEALEAGKLSKTGAEVQEAKQRAEVMGQFVRLANMLFYAAVQDAHPSIRTATDGMIHLSVLKDGMVVQQRGQQRGAGIEILGALSEGLVELLGRHSRG